MPATAINNSPLKKLTINTTTNHLLLVRPTHFGKGSDTVADNSFQQAAGADQSINSRALAEFEGFVQMLRAAGIQVLVVDDTPEPLTPDAVFCNNWFSTHADGRVVLYPMYWPQRRAERRMDIIEGFNAQFEVSEVLDLSDWEAAGDFLESTGSLVLDRTHRLAYAAVSNRCKATAVQNWCDLMGYEPVLLHAYDQRGAVIYHTNVLMACGTHVVPICLEAITDREERAEVEAAIACTQKSILALSLDQIDHFAGNMLEVQTPDGAAWVLSSQAYQALTEAQREQLQTGGTRLLHAPLETIERYGGGSARCMMGEVYLAPKQS